MAVEKIVDPLCFRIIIKTLFVYKIVYEFVYVMYPIYGFQSRYIGEVHTEIENVFTHIYFKI